MASTNSKFICEGCGRSFEHCNDCEQFFNTQSNATEYLCKGCGVPFEQCEQCNLSFNSQEICEASNRRAPKRVDEQQQQQQQYVCDQCHLMFQSAARLAGHRRSHHREQIGTLQGGIQQLATCFQGSVARYKMFGSHFE
nr:zinc finger protein 267-like [Onthophagus taurus]